MEKTTKELKFDKAWVCELLFEIRDMLKAKGSIDADDIAVEDKEDPITVLALIEATLDNVGAIDAVAEHRAEHKLESLKWYRERGRFIFPDMKPPEGWKP